MISHEIINTSCQFEWFFWVFREKTQKKCIENNCQPACMIQSGRFEWFQTLIKRLKMYRVCQFECFQTLVKRLKMYREPNEDKLSIQTDLFFSKKNLFTRADRALDTFSICFFKSKQIENTRADRNREQKNRIAS